MSATPATPGEAIERWLEWLGDLATYRPSDFLMFAPRTYWRLFELHNEAWWPLPLLLPLGGLAALAWAWRGGTAAHRACGAGLAAAAAFVGVAFVLGRYAPINWAAQGLAVLWVGLGLSLLALAAAGGGPAAPGARRRIVAAMLALAALLGYPLLALLAGRPLRQAEVFGLAPDPTAIAILAWLLAGPSAAAGLMRSLRRATSALVTACCLASAATLALLDEWPAALLLAAAPAVAARAARG
ncbi:MAG: hypothetical protein JNL85_16140 [Rubrivivax sp.]|nr:hypothetical protein [Rubrivivax sp.]